MLDYNLLIYNVFSVLYKFHQPVQQCIIHLVNQPRARQPGIGEIHGKIIFRFFEIYFLSSNEK